MTVRPAAHPRLVLSVLASCGVLVAVTQTIVVPLLPELPGLTHSKPADVSWLVTVTLLTGAVFTPLLGRAGDMYGKRRVLLVALASMVLGSLLCAISSALTVLILGRAFQGAAVAVVPLGISILRDELPPDRVIPSIAMMSSTLGVGAAFGIPAATLVVEYANWHTMFWICLALGLLDILAVLLIVPESALRSSGRFDVLGALGLSGFLVCLLLAVSKGSAWGWGSPATVGLFVAAVVIVPLWAAYELRSVLARLGATLEGPRTAVHARRGRRADGTRVRRTPLHQREPDCDRGRCDGGISRNSRGVLSVARPDHACCPGDRNGRSERPQHVDAHYRPSGVRAIVVTVLTNVVATNAGVTAPTLHAYLIVFVIAGACALAAIGLTLLIPARRAVPARHPELAEQGVRRD